jgi:hypothetical protein
VSVWVLERKASDLPRAEFSNCEIAEASWVSLISDWHLGYPEPDPDNVGYLRATYDTADYCKHCGIGKKQTGPFVLKGEPKWRSYGILQLHWVYDEYFVLPAVWQQYFKPFGVNQRAVVNKKNKELETIFQLVTDQECEIETKDLITEQCSSCKRSKYRQRPGLFPRIRSAPEAPILRTKEYFGGGGSASNEILLRQDIVSRLRANGVTGVRFCPVAT